MTKPISASLLALISVINTKIAALEKANTLIADALEIRLHSMNEFRTQLKDQSWTFMLRSRDLPPH